MLHQDAARFAPQASKLHHLLQGMALTQVKINKSGGLDSRSQSASASPSVSRISQDRDLDEGYACQAGMMLLRT